MNGNTSDWRIRVLTAGATLAVYFGAGGLFELSSTRADQPAAQSAGSPESPKSTEGAADAEATATIEPDQLARWIHELDDDRYAVRESAQKHLTAVGAPALQTVSEVATNGSLESSTRAVSVLVAWADSKDNKLSLAALEQISALENRPTEAAMAHERLAVVRESAAIEAIKNLGGRFDYDRQLGMVVGPNAPLQVIIGPQWKGGVDGLRHIAAVRNATTLSLHSAPLKDDALAALASCPQLRRVEIYGTEISSEAVARLQPQMPNAKVEVRGGARLGIRGLPIEQVVVDSPASKGGLERGDNITEFAGQPIKTFEDLTKLIAQCKPGDTVSVKLQRGAETLEKSITFDRWGDDERTMMDSPDKQQGLIPVQVQGGGRIFIQPGGVQVLPANPQRR